MGTLKASKDPAVAAVYGLLAAAVVAALGCSRAQYFRQANQEAYSLIEEKRNDPRWDVPNYRIEMDRRSRYYDPTNPVCPPMPLDDPAAHRYMHCVDGKCGWPGWHKYGDRWELENRDWRQWVGEYAQLTDRGEIRLALDSSVRIAYIHSPNYQNQLETLYLSALDVSTERFRFDVQFFGGNETTFAHQGRLRPGGERNTLATLTDFEMRRRFATAGELLVGFANTFTWQFAGPNQSSALSIVDFSLVQPLLRGAGRDVALEQLTIAERALLSNLRALVRYREGFYTQVAVGTSGVSGLQRRGGFFGGTGLTGFTGTGAGGFGGVGEATGFGRVGGAGGLAGGGGAGAGFAGGGAGIVGGFIGLLQQLQQIRNTQQNLYAQLRSLGLLEAHLEAGTIDLTQVDQFRQNIETERATLLQSENALATTLDTFKTGTLGLPPDVPIDLDDNIIRPFQLIDPAMSQLQNHVYDFLEAFGDQPAEPGLDVLEQTLATLKEIRSRAWEQFAVADRNLAALASFQATGREGLPAERAKEVEETLARLTGTLDELKQRFAATEPALEEIGRRIGPQTRQESADLVVELVTTLSQIIDELSLVQARSRLETVTITPIALPPEEALQIARTNRLDWMNNRAALVDTWRLIQFNADALQSFLDVTVSGDISTVGDNPVKFRAPTGRLNLGLEFDAPFTRLLERNNFRQVLIDYQRDRRQLIQFEDSVHQTLRNILRQLEQLAVNLEIQRRAVAIAIRRVDQTREVLGQPPAPSQPGQPASQLGPTAALNLLTALSDLRSSQNNFMSVWLNYHAMRMQLYRELGIMEIDDCGLWVDRPLEHYLRAREVLPLPPPVPMHWMEQLDGEPSAAPEAGAQQAPQTPPVPQGLPRAAEEQDRHRNSS